MLVARLALSPGRHAMSVPKIRYSQARTGVVPSTSRTICSIGALRRSTGSSIGGRRNQAPICLIQRMRTGTPAPPTLVRTPADQLATDLYSGRPGPLTFAVGSGRLDLGHGVEHLVAVALDLARADAADERQVARRMRAQARDLAQRGVV